MLKVITVIVNEVPDDPMNPILTPHKPILNAGLDIEHGPTVKLSRVHFPDLILSAMLATVDGSKDDGIGMKDMPVQLAGVSKLKDTLTNLGDRTVNLIEEQHHRVITCRLEPVGRAKSGNPVDQLGKTYKVTLSHLRGSTLDNGQFLTLGVFINHLGLANAMATPKKDRLADVSNEIHNAMKSLEINCHYLSTFSSLSTKLT
jgi:hypothetical protein